MNKKNNDVFIAGIIIVYAIVLFASTFSMKTIAIATIGPAFVPRIIAVALLVLSSILIIDTLRKNKLAPQATPEGSAKTEAHGGGRAVLLSLCLIFLYILTLKWLGFLMSSFFYLFFQINLSYGKADKRKRLFFLVLSFVIATAIYVVFAYGFALQLPKGILG